MSQGSQRSPKLAGASTRNRSYPVMVIGLTTFCVALGFVLIHRDRVDEKPALPSTTQESPTTMVEEPLAQATVDEASPKPPSRVSVAHRQSETTRSADGQLTSTAKESLPVASLQAQQLITRIVQSGADAKALTAQGAAEWRQNLKNLTGQGKAAVPAIREFLVSNQDVSFDGSAGQALMGYPTLRAGLFDSLAQIGGPAALGLLAETLQSTADPTDIAALARTLEQQAPGQYRQQALNAARETLDQITKGQLTVADVGPLFQVLQSYGDGAVTPDLAASLAKWPYYGVVALAQLPDGQGIPALVQQLQNTDGSATETRNLALRMLAQEAAQYPDAASALLEQVRQNQISDRAWKQIATGLAGDQFMLAIDPVLAASGMSTIPGLKTYHMQQGNQNFVSLPVGENGMLNQRLDLIGQMLAATSSPAAIAALQNARELLSGKVTK